jgi:hypothetical protein
MVSGPTVGLQFKLPLVQGIAIVPVVTSLNVQLVLGGGFATELHAVPAAYCICANLYSTKFAFPCRPFFWFTNAMIPAKLGVEADVPPTARKLNVVPAQEGDETASASHTT